MFLYWSKMGLDDWIVDRAEKICFWRGPKWYFFIYEYIEESVGVGDQTIPG